jgi:hypothetical protein
VRVIPHRPGIPIETRLLPDDQVVMIEGDEHGSVLMKEPTPSQALAYAVAGSHIAVVVSVDEVRGSLTDDKSWIQTRITGTVVDILMARKPHAVQGERLEVEYEWGGELKIGTCLVRAGHPLHMKAGAPYLLFIRVHDTTGALYPFETPLQISDGRLFSPQEPGRGVKAHPLHGLKLIEVAEQIKRLAK